MTKQPRPSLKESFSGLMYDIFRAAGIAINIKNQESLEKLSPRFAGAVKQEAREAALVLAKRLQQATIDGFNSFGNDLDVVKSDLKELKDEIKRLKNEVQGNHKQPQIESR